MSALILKEEDSILPSNLHKTIARKSLRQILFGQFTMRYVGLCGTVLEVILQDMYGAIAMPTMDQSIIGEN